MRRFDGQKRSGEAVAALPSWINEEWLKGFLEALMERGGNAADRESAAVIVAAARSFASRPFQWMREPRWWELAIRRRNFEKLVGEWKKKQNALAGVKEKENMALQGTVQASFEKDGTELKIRVEVQPHFPVEHEMLERAVKEAGAPFVMEQGKLVIAWAMPVPAKENAAASQPAPTPNSSSSTSVSSSTRGEEIDPNMQAGSGRSFADGDALPVTSFTQEQIADPSVKPAGDGRENENEAQTKVN